jgi:hypothetical protein
MKFLQPRVLLILMAGYLMIPADSCSQSNDSKANVLTQKEKKAGWVLLYDGETGNGWRGANKETFPDKGWETKDGVMTVTGVKGGDIITEKKYADFDLQIEFRVPEQKANSGIKYYVLENEYEQGKALGLEFQTANSHPGEKLRTTLGSVYDVLPPDDSKVHPKEAGEWNQVRIVSEKGKVQHWLNGYLVLEYERGGEVFRKGVAAGKFKDIENFGEAEAGHILLQDHNNVVSFRNIKIREL